jgi:hypothetical protein
MSCRVKILVRLAGIRSIAIWSMDAQKRRIDGWVEVDIQVEAVMGHVGRKLPVEHVVGHDSLFESKGQGCGVVVAEKGGGVAECLIGDCWAEWLDVG